MISDTEELKKEFESGLDQMYIESSVRSTLLLEGDYKKIISEVKEAQNFSKSGKPLSAKHYRRLNRYELLNIGNEEKLIAKRYSENEDIKLYVHREQLFNILHTAHINTGHKREKGMEHELKKKYANITRKVINLYLSKCVSCQLKKKIPKKGLVVKPIISSYMNCRCQVDLIDMQTEPDGEFNFIFNYQDHLTKFLFLRPLKTKTAHEVAKHLVDIFCLIGSPYILQSDNGREFVNSVITELTTLWPGLKLVHGRPRHSQSQGSIERANQDIRDMLITWVNDNNNTKWSEGLKFIQAQKNRSFHRGIGRSPYEAMFGSRQINGLGDSHLPRDVIDKLQTEEDLEELVKNIENNHEHSNEGEETIDNNDKNESEETIDNNDENESEETIDTNSNNKENDNIAVSIDENDSNYQLVQRNKRIMMERDKSHKMMKIQASKMLCESNKRYADLQKGTTVLVRVPDVDRGRLTPRNVLAIVSEINNDGLYKLNTENGPLDRLFSRNELLQADSNFMLQSTETLDKKIPLRTAANMSSKGSGQGFLRCNCKRFCGDNKCSCKQRNKKCNSKCHGSLTCKNK